MEAEATLQWIKEKWGSFLLNHVQLLGSPLSLSSGFISGSLTIPPEDLTATDSLGAKG